jgi:hypothetical protein
MNYQELALKDKASGHNILYEVYFNRKTSKDHYRCPATSSKNPEKAYQKMIRDVEDRCTKLLLEEGDIIYYQICRIDWDLYRDFTTVGTFEYQPTSKTIIELAPEAYGYVCAY